MAAISFEDLCKKEPIFRDMRALMEPAQSRAFAAALVTAYHRGREAALEDSLRIALARIDPVEVPQ